MVDTAILGLVHFRFNVDWAITSLALFPVLRLPPWKLLFFSCHNETLLVATFECCPLSFHWAQLGTPVLYPVTEKSHHHRCPMQSSDSSGHGIWVREQRDITTKETAAVLQIRSSYNFSQELHLIAHIAFQSSDAHAVDWRHHTALQPTCCWVYTSEDLKLGLP